MNTILEFLSYIFSIEVSCMQIYFFQSISFQSKKHNWKKFFLGVLILNLLAPLLSLLGFIFPSNIKFELWFWSIQTFLICLVYFIVPFFIYKNSFSNSMIALFICLFDLLLSEAVAAIVINYFSSNLFQITSHLYIFLFDFFNFLFISFSLYLLIIFLKKHPIQFFSKKKICFSLFIILSLMGFFLIAIYVISNLTTGISLSKSSAFITIILTFLLLADVVFVFITLQFIQKETLKLKSTILQKEIQRELDYYKSLNTQITQMRKIRHDFNNQLQTAYMLLENPNLKISNIPDQSNLRSVFCENKILDFILQSSYSHAKEVGISFNFNVVVPDSIRIEKIDLCSIFSNLLNNAIHAAQKTENPTISLNASYSNNELNVEISNTTLEKDIEYRDPKFHGYGLLILNDLAKKYHGSFSTQKKEGIFYAYFHIFTQS